jgi:hypothetical protein
MTESTTLNLEALTPETFIFLICDFVSWWLNFSLYYKNIAFVWWERLPVANIEFAACCHGLSRLEAAPTNVG